MVWPSDGYQLVPQENHGVEFMVVRRHTLGQAGVEGSVCQPALDVFGVGNVKLQFNVWVSAAVFPQQVGE